MLVKSIMIKKDKLDLLSVENTIQEAIDLLDTKNHLSVPVLDGEKFVGLLSKGYVFENYFNTNNTDHKEFLQKRVGEFMKTTISSVNEKLPIEEAANIFLKSNLRFIPVADSDEKFLGIVTHGNLFADYQKIYGLRLPKIVIYTSDFKGLLAKVATIIAKKGGNIKNIVQKDTEVMGIQELMLRVECRDINKIVAALKENGVQVKHFSDSE